MHRDRIPARARSSRHETVSNPAWPVRGFRLPNPSGSSRIGNRRQRSCCCELLCYFFLNLSKTDISENLRVLARISALQLLLGRDFAPGGAFTLLSNPHPPLQKTKNKQHSFRP